MDRVLVNLELRAQVCIVLVEAYLLEPLGPRLGTDWAPVLKG